MNYSIEFCKEFAESKNGKCLSIVHGWKEKMLWECHQRHQWLALWRNIYYNNSWCPHCINRIVTIEEIHILAQEKKGECLSKKYVNNRKLMDFRCQYNHKFKMSARKVKHGQWCKYCSKYITQEKIRYILQSLTGYDWPSNRKVIFLYEIDMYSSVDNIGFEYNGRQHYHLIKEYHKNGQGFESQKKRDKIKLERCRQKT